MFAFPRLAAVVTACLATALLGSCSEDQPAEPQHASSDTPTAAAPSASASPTLPPAPPPMSDKEQVVAALQAVADASNTRNWDAYLELQCPEVRAKYTGQLLEALKLSRDKQGLTSFKVIDVTIDGDTAKLKVEATNEILGTGTITIPMERSDGWKMCAPNGATS